ncbi:hypothetical protein NPX13_g8299 [Xylaria arbuscula]|uniref:Uncharacterized protein n=1 Tax=Xylaria arbuscula TaxID=114810 RepID=A0A9W8TJK1_9PEZI|nr:hypothetical protein NPX13_g8299 [Xylaria arbuscula]
MFSAFANLVPQATPDVRPENVPPPTPLNLPRCNPQLPQSTSSSGKRPCPSLVRFLQTLHRPAEVNESHFAALGVHVHVDAPGEDVVPDPSFLPSASGWDGIDLDEARRRDPTFRRPLSNGRLSPEARSYVERRDELSIPNQAAFRTVRRMKPEPGKPAVRLGNCYEFFRQLEFLNAYWDDTSLPAPAPQDDAAKDGQEPEQESVPERITYRTAPGSQMPAEIRHNLVSTFVKLVSAGPPSRRLSYFSSGCVFICRTPMTREAARAGIVEGPIAAVSARNTTSFTKPIESNIDFGRELIAALVTAQLRAREGKTEKRFGEGQWWATAKRWGGGEGGPIGREVEGDLVVGDKDAFGGQSEGNDSSENPSSSVDKPSPQESGYPRGIPVRGAPLNKKPRKTLSVYDRYRMVRMPTSNWDKKVRYEAIGKIKGSGYDDVFVVSSLFHHLSILRVRVPERLLLVLDGTVDDSVEEEAQQQEQKQEKEGNGGDYSWGKLEIWRSQWFDLFIVEQRLEAVRLLWGLMAWSMRQTDHGNDEVMTNA